MHGLIERTRVASRNRRSHAGAKATFTCESLEDRKLLSSGLGFRGGLMGGMDYRGSRTADLSLFGAGRQGGSFGGGSMGLGGGMRNPTLLLTAPLLDGGSGSTTPPSPSVLSSTGVQQAFQTLQTDFKNDIPSGAKPTHASIGALQDDLDAIHAGTLSGSAAQTKIQADQAAILVSMGLTQAQITQVQSDQQALQTAIQTASSASTATSTSTSTSTATSSSTNSAGPSSAVQTAFSTLQTDLKNDTPSGGQPTHESIGVVHDDLDAIRNGTLTGSAAVTQVQADTAAVLTSMGLTSAQITQIQSDQAAVAAAIQASANTATTTTSSTTASTLQSVSAYVVGLPGIGMRVAIGGMGSGGSFPGGPSGGPMFVTRGPGGSGMGWGSGPRGGFMMGR